MKKLYRSDDNKVFAGIVGGLGEYFDIDPILLRLIFVALALLTGIIPGLIIYILAILIIPAKKSGK